MLENKKSSLKKTVKIMILKLNDDWKMKKAGDSVSYVCDLPCSVYKTLTDSNVLENPYYRDNELRSTSICEEDYVFTKEFEVSKEMLLNDFVKIHFYGLDTLCEIRINDNLIATTNNMHCQWDFDVKEYLKAGINNLEILCKSPINYINKMQSERRIWGDRHAMDGFTHLRKPHYMFGWDWGPQLPDMGIWRDVELYAYTYGKISDLYYSQKHSDGMVTLDCKVNFENYGCDNLCLDVFSPDGEMIASTKATADNGEATLSVEITNPQLWWANGYGKQPLYKAQVRLVRDGETIDVKDTNIGLRTLTISQEADQWGNEFCFILNGKKIFAMGANYIPEDQIITRSTKEKTEKLLENCVKANYNFIRVWGGGHYPSDEFYDYCDKAGLIVWQDFMFACAAYLLTDEFEKAVRKEFNDNIIRLRNHPSLGLWCGNNEIESAWVGWGLPEDNEAKADYLILFEKIIPEILSQLDPNTFYWPSSPSSGGGFDNPSSNHAGDMHYWDVWHNFKPIEDFRKYHYRFCSEYGFESLPSIKTVKTFADETKGDYNLTSPVMDNHQKCDFGNEKIMYYLAQMVRYPYTFDELIYSSQLVQADCIRSNVEHMRRSRGRCMGSAYWQVNDSNPVISWSSIDYYGRWKPLHYCAKRFYAPILLSVDDSDILKPVFNISNETFNDVEFEIKWNLRKNTSEILADGSISGQIKELSSENIATIDLSDYLETIEDKRSRYLEYTLFIDGKAVSNSTTLFVRPKLFTFIKPTIDMTVSETDKTYEITVSASAFTKSVWLDLKDEDALFSDNWFDIHGNEKVTVTVNKNEISKYMNIQDFKSQLVIKAYNAF